MGTSSVLIAEATAMRNGIQAAIQAGYVNLQIEGDNQILIHAIQERIQPPWEIQTLVQNILAYIQLCNNIVIYHIFKEGNRTADWVAKAGHSILSKIVWHVVPHRDLLSILCEDNLGRTLRRMTV